MMGSVNKIKRRGQIIVLTGGIASGKTIVLKHLAKLGFQCINTDEMVKTMLKEDKKLIDKLLQAFPSEPDLEGIIKQIKREHAALDTFEKIIYPDLVSLREEKIAQLQALSDKTIVIETPLFFEKQLIKHYNLVISVVALLDIRRERVSNRGVGPEFFDFMARRQVGDDIRFEKSDVVIDTSGTVEQTISRLEGYIENE